MKPIKSPLLRGANQKFARFMTLCCYLHTLGPCTCVPGLQLSKLLLSKYSQRLFYRGPFTQDVPKQTRDHPFPLENSGNIYDQEGYQLDIDHFNGLNSYINCSNDAVNDEHYVCRTARQISITAHIQVPGIVPCQDTGSIMIVKYCNILKRPCSLTSRVQWHFYVECYSPSTLWVWLLNAWNYRISRWFYLLRMFLSASCMCPVLNHWAWFILPGRFAERQTQGRAFYHHW